MDADFGFVFAHFYLRRRAPPSAYMDTVCVARILSRLVKRKTVV